MVASCPRARAGKERVQLRLEAWTSGALVSVSPVMLSPPTGVSY